MCTAIGWQGRHFMFGRNLDLEYGFHERVTQVARGSLLRFAAMPPARTAYAMLGMAAEEGGFPLFAEAVNECGLCAAGLYFPHSARMLSDFIIVFPPPVWHLFRRRASEPLHKL